MNDGLAAKSFRSIPIAIEHHTDGSVTIAAAVREEIANASDVPSWVKDLLFPPPNGQIFMINNSFMNN